LLPFYEVWRSSQRSPETLAAGRGMGEQEREGKKKREERAGQGSGRAQDCVVPVEFLPQSAAAYNSEVILKTSILSIIFI